MKNFILYSLLAAAILFISCAENETPVPEFRGETPVEFVTTVSGTPFHAGNGGYTRVVDANWSAGDRVGIFMYDHDAVGAIDDNAVLAANRKYTADASGRFTTDTENMLTLEETGPVVDFFAYYPYRNGQDNIYSISLTDQSDQEALDFLYAVTTTGYDADNMPIALTFSHQLTKLVFNVNSDVEVSTFSAVVNDIITQGKFDLYNGDLMADGTRGDVTMKSTVDGKTVTVEAIVYPQGDVSGKKIDFTVNGQTATWTIPAGTTWEKGEKTSYKVNITGGDADAEINYGWFETPAITDIPNTTFLTYSLPEADRAKVMRNYSMLYDTRYMIAYWVAYPMCAYYREGSSSSTNYSGNWFYDPSFSENLQPDAITAWPNPQNGVYYDRGHQLPSADRRYSLEANKTTYFVTNQTAQQKDLNQGIWARLEDRVRVWMNQCDTIYVVTGAHLTTKDDQTIQYVRDNSNKNVALPKYYYKALAKYTIATDTYHTIAFKMDNEDIPGVWGDYSMTVKELEEETGFTFFPHLPDEVKSTVTSSQWQ